MFSIFKKVSIEQEVVLQDLTEEQLTQAAGGRDHGRNWGSHKRLMKHHRRHHRLTNQNWNGRRMQATGSHSSYEMVKRTCRQSSVTPFTGHW